MKRTLGGGTPPGKHTPKLGWIGPYFYGCEVVSSHQLHWLQTGSQVHLGKSLLAKWFYIFANRLFPKWTWDLVCNQ